MPPFTSPKPKYSVKESQEKKALNRHLRERGVPRSQKDHLLLASWNIANLGLQKRRDKDHRILAEIISWFDVVAIQEVNDNLEGLRGIQMHLPGYEILFSDKAGNDERMAYIYDADKVSLLEKVGEIAVPVKDKKFIKLTGINRIFNGFDRNPYLAAFQAGAFRFILVNAHLFFGDDTKADRERRSLEAYAIARWADLRRDDKHAYVEDIIALGDFNLPKVEKGDPIYDALRKRGLRIPEHSTKIASNIANDKDYDQLLFFPGKTKQEFTGAIGIFDFDSAIFRGIWETKTPAQFRSYVRYYISDHRPHWAEFEI